MKKVKPKKRLGQHFLKDPDIAQKIVFSLFEKTGLDKVVEVGPGMGALTQYLLQNKTVQTYVIEPDPEATAYLRERFPDLAGRIYEADFLKFDFDTICSSPKDPSRTKFAVIGNFPYNISSQILFKILEHRDKIDLVVGMFQKEVAERICSGPNSKKYGILSVLVQAYYDLEYLFTVTPEVFSPPPKVQSGLIRLQRNNNKKLGCDEAYFKRLVKTGFNQRRKTLKNALKPLADTSKFSGNTLFTKRAEQLSVDDFVILSNLLGQP